MAYKYPQTVIIQKIAPSPQFSFPKVHFLFPSITPSSSPSHLPLFIPFLSGIQGQEITPASVILLGSSQEPMSCSPGCEMAQSTWLMVGGQQPSPLPLILQSAHTAQLEKKKQARNTREPCSNTSTMDKVRQAKPAFPGNLHLPLTGRAFLMFFSEKQRQMRKQKGKSFNTELSTHC